MPSAIIDPTRGQRPRGAAVTGVPVERPERLDGLRIGLLENTKRNAATFLDEVGIRLAERAGGLEFVRRTKTQFAIPLTDDQVEEIRSECDVVVIGVGDCGSCSASAVADGILLEAKGIPTAVVCTDAFEATSRAMAELQSRPDYPFLLTEHPVANLTPEQVAGRAAGMADDILRRLTAPQHAVAVS